MKRLRVLFELVFILVAPLLSGCANYQLSRLIGEKYGATSIQSANAILAYPAAQGAAFSSSHDAAKPDERLRFICALPPAQAAMQVEQLKQFGGTGKISNEGQGKFEYMGIGVEAASKLDLALAIEYASRRTESIAKLYEQNERTLFLQFALYRLCESFNNGMLNKTESADFEFATLAVKQDAAAAVAGAEVVRLQAELPAKQQQLLVIQADLKNATAATGKLEADLAREGKPKAEDLERLTRSRAIGEDLKKSEARTMEAIARLLAQIQVYSNSQVYALATAKSYRDFVGKGLKYNSYEAQFEHILETATAMAEDRRVLEAESRASGAESNVKMLEAQAAKAKAEEGKTKAEEELKSIKAKLKEAEDKAENLDKAKAEAELAAYRKCVESKTCSPK